VSATQDTELVDSNVIRYPLTLNCQADDENQSALTLGICGTGWESLQTVAATGFGGS
jgi:hypothetical protein